MATGTLAPERAGAAGRLRALAGAAAEPLAAVALALVVGAVLVLVAGFSPLDAYEALLQGSVGSSPALAQTLTTAIPVVIVGVGVAVAFRVGLLNLGGEGQMVVGALVTAVLAHALRGLPAALLLPLVVLAGALAGALLAALPGWWEVRFGVPLVLTTLLLNYVAALGATYVATYPLRDRTGGSTVAQTAPVPEGLVLPVVSTGFAPLHWGVAAAVVLPVVVLWMQRRTVLGYTMRMTGLNRRFAEYGGVPMGRTVLVTMAMSGAICGLAGALLVLGETLRYLDGSITGPGTAWTGLTAALIALFNPVATVLAGAFLAALTVGGTGLQLTTDVPLQLVNVIQAVVILTITVRLVVRRRSTA